MGLVYKMNDGNGYIKSYSAEVKRISDALLTPGQEDAEVTLAAMTQAEARALLLKCDMLVSNYQNQAMSVAVAEAFPVIMDLVRAVKTETKSTFRGIKGMGKDLDIKLVRPEDIGGAMMSSGGTSATGIYGGTGAAVFTWLQTFTAGTSDDLIPSQIMKEEAGLIHLGIADTVDIPKVNAIKFTLAGVATPIQSLSLNYKDGSSKVAFSRFEMPIVALPETTHAIQIDPYITGDSKPELLSFLVGMASDFTFA